VAAILRVLTADGRPFSGNGVYQDLALSEWRVFRPEFPRTGLGHRGVAWARRHRANFGYNAAMVRSHRFVFVICGALLLGSIIYFLSGKTLDSGGQGTHRVLGIGNQFSSEIATLAEPFNKLVGDANTRIEYRSSVAKQYRTATAIISWTAVAMTVLITILAGVLGIDVSKLLTSSQPEKRSNIVVLLTFLAAFSAALQVVDAKVQRDSTQNKEAAETLFQQTATARARFASAGSSTQIAQEASDSLSKALFTDTIER
jgi:hypothetical protein